MAVIFLLISCYVSLSAAAISIENPRSTETLLIDTRIPVFVDGHWQIMSDDETCQVARRQAKGITTAVEVDLSTIAPSPTAAASPLPSPFDGALAANFSGDDGKGSCPAFVNSFLADPTFKSCYPVSILLQSSHGFFEAEKSLVGITQVLDAACTANVDYCTDYLRQLSDQLVDDKNCGEDYRLENSLVVQAYEGMRVYETVYRATCLQDPNDVYCFGNAVTNLTTPSNVYLYYMPFNSTLPDTAAPSCNECTTNTMAIYQAATAYRSSAIAYTYPGAAQQINSICGTSFVNETLPIALTENAGTSLYQPPSSILWLSLIVIGILRWIF